MTKVCPGCQQEKEANEYGKLSKSRDGLSYRCKVCLRKREKGHYLRSPERRSGQASRAQQRRLRNRRYVYAYLTQQTCVDCGISDPRVLTFDHVDQATKSFNIADASYIGLEKLKAEIEKCVVVCANCHLIRTADQLGWYKYLDLVVQVD